MPENPKRVKMQLNYWVKRSLRKIVKDFSEKDAFQHLIDTNELFKEVADAREKAIESKRKYWKKKKRKISTKYIFNGMKSELMYRTFER